MCVCVRGVDAASTPPAPQIPAPSIDPPVRLGGGPTRTPAGSPSSLRPEASVMNPASLKMGATFWSKVSRVPSSVMVPTGVTIFTTVPAAAAAAAAAQCARCRWCWLQAAQSHQPGHNNVHDPMAAAWPGRGVWGRRHPAPQPASTPTPQPPWRTAAIRVGPLHASTTGWPARALPQPALHHIPHAHGRPPSSPPSSPPSHRPTHHGCSRPA